MSKEDLGKIKGQMPVSVIVHGGNFISFLLAKTLLEQGSYVVIIDKYTNNSKRYFAELKKTGKITFIDFKGIKSFFEKIARIDYLYYMLGERVLESKNVDSKDFLLETDYLNQSLITANKYKAKIAVVTSLKLNRELSNIINNEASSKTRPYSPLELQRYGENFSAEFVDKTKANLRIIRLGTVLGRGVNKIDDPVLEKLFLDATQNIQIDIEGEGLEIHNLIHESDAVYGILKLTFSDDTKGEVITLSNKNDYSTLSIAYKLLELDLEAKAIKFVERESGELILQDLYVPAPHASSYGWKQNVTLEEATIEQVQAYYEKSDKKWDVDKTAREKALVSESAVSKTKFGEFVSKIFKPFKSLSDPKKFFSEINYFKIFKNISIFVLLVLLVYYLIAPIIGVSLGTFLVYQQGKQLSDSVAELNFEEITKNSNSISQNIYRVEDNFNKLFWIFKLGEGEDEYANLFQIIQGTKYVAESGENLVIGLRPLGEFIKDFEPSLNEDIEKMEYSQYLSEMDSNTFLLKEGIYKLSLAENLISQADTRKYPNFVKESVSQYKELVEEINNKVKPLEKVSQFLPDMLGLNERKRYLILLQDNGEIRSTGGWISNYAVVAIEKGQVVELFVDDIYNAHAFLKLQNSVYKTPNSMLRALEGVSFSFPTVNWNPNLENVSLSSEEFIYDLGKGESLDGIITLDTLFIQRLIEKWGGIEVPGESELITSENLYAYMFKDIEIESPSQPRNSTFLTELFNSIVTKIFSTKLTENHALYETIEENIDEKHLLFTFKNSLAKTYVEENGWTSNIDTKFQSAPTNIDWNWGANKANLYLKKNHNLNISVKDEKTVDYTYQITFQNESTKEEFPQGEYVNYLRIYIPYNAEVTTIKGVVDNKYDIYLEDGYKVVGGWHTTPTGQTTNFELRYRVSTNAQDIIPLIKKTDTHYEMNIDIFKQPGSRKDAYNFSLSYPQNWVVENSDGLTRIENSVNRRFELASDEHFFISWQR